jgi:predicted transcriptional regulator
VGLGKPYISRIENGRLDIRWSTLTGLLRETGSSLSDLQAVLAEIEESA